MDLNAEMIVLASGGAGTLVGAMTTDAWTQAKRAVVNLWRKHHPEASADVEQLMDVSRDELLTADGEGHEVMEAQLKERWRGLFQELLSDHPDAADDLAALAADIDPAAGPGAPLIQIVRAGHDAFTAGQDQTINISRPE